MLFHIPDSVYRHFLEFALNITRDAGNILSHYFRNLDRFDNKSEIDLVSVADLESEALITKAIQHSFPTHDIIAEENDLTISGSDYCWIIDPLDGTTNYIHGLPLFGISVALQFRNTTILGVVYNPVTKEFYYACEDTESYQNGQPISTSNKKHLIESIISTGFPYNHDQLWHLSFDLFRDMYSRTQGLRRLGSASIDLCYTAKGIFDGYYEFGLKPWDIAAGELILRKAGGSTSHWDGGPVPFSGDRIVAGNKVIHQELMTILRQEKYKLFYSQT